ncbi:MAG: hypothetical protein ACRDRU_27455 [Pseudonocardiaceae bacterium]
MSTAPVWQGSDAELLAELGALETRLHSTWAQVLSVVAEIDSRGVAGGLGYGTPVAPKLPATAAAVAKHAIGASDVAVIRSTKDAPETRRWLSFRDRDGGYELAGWLDGKLLRSSAQR